MKMAEVPACIIATPGTTLAWGSFPSRLEHGARKSTIRRDLGSATRGYTPGGSLGAPGLNGNHVLIGEAEHGGMGFVYHVRGDHREPSSESC